MRCGRRRPGSWSRTRTPRIRRCSTGSTARGRRPTRSPSTTTRAAVATPSTASTPRAGARAASHSAAELLVEHADVRDLAVALLELQLAGGPLRLARPRVPVAVEQDELVVRRL